MKLSFQGRYGPFTDFETPKLPEFCIITGPNGSGKTLFLNLLSFFHKQEGKEIIKTRNNEEFRVKIISKKFKPGIVARFYAHGISFQNHNQRNYRDLGSIKLSLINNLPNIQKGNRGVSDYLLAERIAKSIDKPLENLNTEDIHDYDLSGKDIISDDYFRDHIADIFYQYCFRREENQYSSYRNYRYQTNFKSLSKEEFDKSFPEPWTLLNKFLEKIRSDYVVEGISEEAFFKDSRLIPKLYNRNTGGEILFNQLSDGEKVMISLAVCLFNFNEGDLLSYPNMLLLDEPDSKLHPSLTKIFLDVLLEEFVNNRGIKVFLTTHSPTTVALTEEKFLFGMSATEKRFFKIKKDNALQLLTIGLNTLSLDYENRRQIFVESNYDLEFYERTYQNMKDQLLPGVTIHFISSGVNEVPKNDRIGDGDCQRVKTIVRELVDKGGNKNIYGIIDWDGKNKADKNILVNGYKIRYSLENYLFDPVILAALLLDNRIISRDQLELDKNAHYRDFRGLKKEKLNYIIETVCAKVKKKAAAPYNEEDLVEVEYLSGHIVNIPQWYLKCNGHQLELDILKAFPELRSQFSPKERTERIKSNLSESEKEKQKTIRKKQYESQTLTNIKRQIINKILDDIPLFIPIEIKNLFIEIQKTH